MFRIAAAINNEDENFFWHFGHCERFKLYDIEDGKVKNTSYITVTGGHGPQRLEAMVSSHVNVVLTDGMGPGIAVKAPEFNLEIVAGVKGNADEAVEKYLKGELQSDESAVHPCGQD